MTQEKQRHTFISYSRVNKQFALKLARELKAAGFPVWMDQLDIPAGARWDDAIEKALSECGIFLTILTPASIASENAKDEIGYAIDHGKRILPVLLEDCEIPLRLRRFQYVDFTSMNYDQGIRTAKDLLSRLMKEESTPVRQVPATKERPTRPVLQAPPPLREAAPAVSMPAPSQRRATPVIFLGMAILLVLGLIGGASYLMSRFAVPPPVPTITPTLEAEQPIQAPSSTVAAQTPTPEFMGFYTEEFETKLDGWKFFRISERQDSLINYEVDPEKGKLVVHIGPKGDVPQGYLINPNFSYGDVQLELITRNTGINANGVSLICRYSENGWYEFWISNDQSYGIYAFGPNGEIPDSGYQLYIADSPKINDGRVENVYQATCRGDDLTLAVNGTVLKTVKARYGYTEGNIGIGFSAPKQLPIDVEFDALRVSAP